MDSTSVFSYVDGAADMSPLRARVRVEDISAKTLGSSVNPLNNSCYLVGILCLDSPTILFLSNNDDTQRECVKTSIPKPTGLATAMGPIYFPTQTHLAFVNVPHKWGTFAHPDIDRVCLSPSLDHRERL